MSENSWLWLLQTIPGHRKVEGYLIKVVVMALAGEVTQELSPILSWSNNNYDLKLGEKARGQELHIRSAVDVVMF